jgi:hypothetical protein
MAARIANRRKVVISRVFAALAAFVFVSSASASTVVTYNNVFTADDDKVTFHFVVDNPLSTVSIFTTSFANGGFIPVLSIFAADTGELLKVDSGYADSRDALLQDWPTVPDATYTVILTEYDNLPNSLFLADGFVEDGAGNFTIPTYGSGPFGDLFGTRTGDWSVTFSSLDPTLQVVPEPGAGVLAGAGMLLLFWLRRKRAARN